MNKLQRMEFLTERIKDRKIFLVQGYKMEAIYNHNCEKFYWIEPTDIKKNNITSIEKISITFNDMLCLDFSLPPAHTFTPDELVIMKHLPYKWLVRNKGGKINNCKCKPKKDDIMWLEGEVYRDIAWLDHLFPTIQFGNGEPLNRDDFTTEEGEN